MRLLITGGAGFIGSNLVRLALARGHQVLNLDKLTYAGNLASLEDVAQSPGYRFFQADICDPAALRHAFDSFQPHAVMHLAAESHVDRSIDGPGAFIQTNLVGTYTLLEASLEYWRSLPAAPGSSTGNRGSTSNHPRSPIPDPPSQSLFRFHHISTDEVYGSLGPAGEFTEETAYDPHSPYSASKAGSDHLVRAWHHTYGLPVLVTNCSNNYGPWQFPEKLIPVVILKALRGEPIPVYGTGENIRDWLYVEDHADALLTVVERGIPGSTYNIGGDNELRNIDLVRLLCQILDELRPASAVSSYSGLAFSSLITFVADRPGHDLRYAIDASKIRRELGWQPKQDHQSGFRQTVQWYLDHRAWWQAILDRSYRLERLGTIC